MRSSWRVGEFKKTVIEFDVTDDDELEFSDGPFFDGTIQVSLGAVRGDTFALVWGDTKKTRLKTFQFTNSAKYGIRKIEDLQTLNITHNFSKGGGQYGGSIYTTKGVGLKPPKLRFKVNDGNFDVSISEGGYKRHPALADSRYSDTYGSWHRWNMPDKKELTLSLLRVKLRGKYQYELDEDIADFNLAYELNWAERKTWKLPSIDLRDSPNVLLPEHSEEEMKVSLGRKGKCTAKGYAIGLDDEQDSWRWNIQQPRRLEQDISRMGVWKGIYVEFSKARQNEDAKLQVTGIISKNLINPEPGKRFLLTNSRVTNPKDWVNIKIKLVLPPTTLDNDHGKITLAAPAPAAYFRHLGMRDPEIPWADPGFKDPNWGIASGDPSGTAVIAADQQPEFIRTGCLLHQDVVDAEIVTRVVGWGDDGAVWVWDVAEKDILVCAELATPSASGTQSPMGTTELVGKKLGYVNDVKGIAVTGDRLVQRIFLFTYGNEQRVHKGGTLLDDGEDRDSGISALRREDMVRKIEEARRKTMRENNEDSKTTRHHQANDPYAYLYEGGGDEDEDDGRPSDPNITTAEERYEENSKWRMMTYSFGDQMGNAGGFHIDSTGNLESQW
ncbi:hypothetical protein ABW20_dc0104876 [Dactylellina cionopaga]|nr:hypothetical protein ABW20_dc0104876 [Dactylellina cionopaga]